MTRQPEEPRVLALSGDLTAREVPDRYAESLAWQHQQSLPVVVDLTAVRRTDSSALALLLEWRAWAKARGEEMAFRNPPAALQTVASLSAASELMGWPSPAVTAGKGKENEA